MFTGADMLNAPFFINGYDSVDIAFKAFRKKGLLKKEFTTKLDNENLMQQLSEWLELCKLVNTLDDVSRYKDTNIRCKINSSLKHQLIFDSHEFMVTRSDEDTYMISTSIEYGFLQDYVYNSAIQCVSDAITGLFWDMFMECYRSLDQVTFSELHKQLHNQNYAKYIEYEDLIGVWTAVEDLNPLWFEDAEIPEAHTDPSRTIQFTGSDNVILGGSLCGTIKSKQAVIDKTTNVIILHDLIIARLVKCENENLEVEYFYCYDWFNDSQEDIPNESPREYLKEVSDKRRFIFNRLIKGE